MLVIIHVYLPGFSNNAGDADGRDADNNLFTNPGHVSRNRRCGVSGSDLW